jgi:hypothetical protein
MRTDLCAKALRLGRMLASLTPHDTESLGLLSLMELQASRLKARTGPGGEPVLLMDQDWTRWDHLLIRRGLAILDRIDQLGGNAGPYALQAAIAVCHARATAAEESDWVRIAALCDGLAQISPSPIVELNRGVAMAQAFGPRRGWTSCCLCSMSPSFASTTCCRRSPATCSAPPVSMVVPGSTSSSQPGRKLSCIFRSGLSAFVSTSTTLCQVPSAGWPPSTGSVSDGEMNAGST